MSEVIAFIGTRAMEMTISRRMYKSLQIIAAVIIDDVHSFSFYAHKHCCRTRASEMNERRTISMKRRGEANDGHAYACTLLTKSNEFFTTKQVAIASLKLSGKNATNNIDAERKSEKNALPNSKL